MSVEQLNGMLQKFYTAARTNDGKLYSKKSFLSIRYGLQTHFEKLLNIDIVNSPDFGGANKIFQAMLVKLKQEGKGQIVHKEPLSREDLNKLYDSFDLDTPRGLQNKVFVDFMMYFCNRGRENLRSIKTLDFIFDDSGTFIVMRDMATKNHKGGLQDENSQGGRIYKTNTDMCPYTSFKKYLSVLNPNCEMFFQRPKEAKPEDIKPWYDNVPVGKQSLGNKMKKLSTEANLSRSYTNHCLRATSITLLDGFDARHIMTVSGRKSESSIRSYSRTSEQQKQRMALTIAEAASGTKVNNPAPVAVPMNDVQETVKSSGTSSMDFLEITSSQEEFLSKEIDSYINEASVFNVELPRVCSHSSTGYVAQRSDYVAPVYYFNNSTVHIHHH